jgi:hypothetical protein
MDDDTKQELIEYGKVYFTGYKTTWTGKDLETIYRLYNLINGTDKVDTNCNSCRRETITSVRDSYMQAIK